MGKIVLILIILNISLFSDTLVQNCLNCHQKQQIPNEMIYRKYLTRYSTKSRIKNIILQYLKDPKKVNSIMPPQFFLKFPMKKPINLDEEQLKESIDLFIDKFDIRKRLILE